MKKASIKFINAFLPINQKKTDNHISLPLKYLYLFLLQQVIFLHLNKLEKQNDRIHSFKPLIF